jgi:hypothetical protein
MNIVDLPRDTWFIIIDYLLLTVYNEIIEDEPKNFYWNKVSRKKKKFIIKNSCGLGRTCKTIYDYLKQYEKFINNSSAEMQFFMNKENDEKLHFGRFDSRKIKEEFIKNIIKIGYFDVPPEYIKNILTTEFDFASPIIRSYYYDAIKIYPYNNKIILKYDECENIIVLRGNKKLPRSNISLLMMRRYYPCKRSSLILYSIKAGLYRGAIESRFYLCNDVLLSIGFKNLFKNNSKFTFNKSCLPHIKSIPGGPLELDVFVIYKGLCLHSCILWMDKKTDLIKINYVHDLKIFNLHAVSASDDIKEKLRAANDQRFGKNTMKEIGFRLLDLVEMLRAAEFEDDIYEGLQRLILYVFG